MYISSQSSLLNRNIISHQPRNTRRPRGRQGRSSCVTMASARPRTCPPPPAALHRPTAAVLALCATPRPPRCRRTWAAARNDGRDGWGCWWCVVAARAWAQPVIGGDMKQAVHACSPRCRAAGDWCCAPHLSAPPCRLCVCVVACTGDLHFRHHGIVG
jgi:hypothetical protein